MCAAHRFAEPGVDRREGDAGPITRCEASNLAGIPHPGRHRNEGQISRCCILSLPVLPFSALSSFCFSFSVAEVRSSCGVSPHVDKDGCRS